MARIHKKMALYEVIGKKNVVVHDNAKIEELRPEKAENEVTDLDFVDIAKSESETASNVKWPTKPRILQLNAGRVEISLPNQLAVAVVLGILLMAVACYRIGQIGSYNDEKIDEPTTVQVAKAPVYEQSKPANSVFKTPINTVVPKPKAVENVKTISTEGTNVIVIQNLQDRSPLEPVKEFFAANGIETEIIYDKGSYCLITKQRYERDPLITGSEGYIVLQKIIKLGSEYKSPPGYGSFGPKPFAGAYGMKISN